MNNIQFTELKALAETIFNNYMSYQDVKSNWEGNILQQITKQFCELW